MAENYNYVVHAKMYPTMLAGIAVFLLLKDASSLGKFFFTNQTVSLHVIKAPLFQKQWMNVSKVVLKLVGIGYFTIIPILDYVV